jgi:PAS domain S-box-containing protein
VKLNIFGEPALVIVQRLAETGHGYTHDRLPMTRNFHHWLIIALIVILAGGMALTLWSVQREDNLQRTDLLTKTHRLSNDLNTGDLVNLTGSDSDLLSAGYITLKDQMTKIPQGDPDIRFAYLLGQRPDGAVIFYADSSSPDSADYSPPGQVYSEASATLRDTFSSGRETTEGPLTDRWGTWVSGLVPFTDPRTGKVIAVLGTDVDANNWNIHIIMASAPAVMGMLVLVFLLLVFFYILERNEKEKQILMASEAMIRESENRYRTVFESTGTAMVILNEDTSIGFANKEFFHLTGYSQEEIDKKRSWTEFIFRDDLEKMIEQHRLRREDPQKALKQYEFRLITKSGEVRSILLTIDLLPGTKSSVGSLIDITDQKTTEAIIDRYASEITHYAEALMRSTDRLNLLNSITWHDILNQITAILGYLELMKMKYPDAPLRDLISKEIQAAENVRTQILFTKEYQEIGVHSPQWFDLKNVIASAASGLPLSAVKLVVQAGNVELHADPMFEKVFYTLLENALRHGETVTTIEFTCSVSPEGLVVTCQDDGAGVPGEFKEAIFQRKYYRHTGFGLFLSRTILGITGMTIRETGIYGKGARFEILVPPGAYRFP